MRSRIRRISRSDSSTSSKRTSDARGHVAVAVRRHAHFELAVRHARIFDAQIPRLTAGAAGQADQSELRRKLGRHPAAGNEAVLQPRMLVVNILEQGNRLCQRIALAAQLGHAVGADVTRDAPRNDQIHQITVAEQRVVQAQHVLLETGELRQSESKARIVAEEPEIAEMVGDALALEQQCAQPDRPRRRCCARCAFDRHRIRPRISNRRIAGNARRQPRTLQHVHLFEALFDALVLVAQPFFEPQHALADDAETEVAGFYGAGMHRANGDLVHAVAGDLHKRIGVGFRSVTGDR